MKYVFWISVGTIAYTYFGYPLVLWFLAKLRARPVRKGQVEPTISILIAAHNEAENLAVKLQNLKEIDYPEEKLEVIVSSDGSIDGTEDILKASPLIRATISDCQQGKAAALNRAIELATGEILVFMDVRQRIEVGALRALVSNFADPTVGAVSGELVLPDVKTSSGDVGLYWRFEKAIRKLESATGSVMGVTGAFYAARRDSVSKMPAGLILDDLYSPLKVMQKGQRVVFEPQAIAVDRPSFSPSIEFRRKVRTLMGNYEIVKYIPRVIIPLGSIGFRFISHKFLRLMVPWLLILTFTSSIWASSSPFYLVMAVLQALFYGAGAMSISGHSEFRLLRVAGTFCLLNAAAFVALFAFLRRSDDVATVWRPTNAVASEQLSRGAKGRS